MTEKPEEEQVDVVEVTGRFDGLNNLLTHVPSLVRAARRDAKSNGMTVDGRVVVTVTAEIHPKDTE